MQSTALSKEIDLFCSARQASFLLKADLKIANNKIYSVQKHKEAELIANLQNIAQLSRQFFGQKPQSIVPLSRQGTFHLLYRVVFSETENYIIRTSMSAFPFRALDFYFDQWALNILEQKKLPTVRIYEIDVSREKYSFDYEIMEEARGSLFGLFAIDRHNPQNIVYKLGEVVGRLHEITAAGFGLLDVRRVFAKSEGKGLFNTWQDFVLRNLEKHIQTCRDIKAITLVESRRIESLFIKTRNILANIKPSLLHGDLGSGNIFSDGKEITGIIDWEDCLSGDPLFDVALWGTFIGNDERRAYFFEGYKGIRHLPEDFELRYWLYHLRIVLAKTVLRYRYRYYLSDKIPASVRVNQSLTKLESVLS
jgi:fructosamine-3-kinase